VGELAFDERSAMEQELDGWVVLRRSGTLAVRLIGANRDASSTSPPDTPIMERADRANRSGERDALRLTYPYSVRDQGHLARRTADGPGVEVDAECIFREVGAVVDRRDFGDDLHSVLCQSLTQRATAIRLITYHLSRYQASCVLLG